MTLDRRRAQLWDAMGLGPQWLSRSVTDVAVSEPATGEAVAVAAAVEPEVAHVATQRAPVTTRAAATGNHVSGIAAMDWTALQATVAGCTACALSRTRTQTVFGVGHRSAHCMIVGEAPGAEEDARGDPFVGQAGRLLDNMLAAIGLSRTAGEPASAVYIANVLKCRPPGNRNPAPDEVQCCEPYLRRQIELVAPRVLIVMGRFAAQSLLGTDASIASLRGRVHRIDIAGRSVPLVVSYHPAYLLRNLVDKSKSWADLCLAKRTLGDSA